MSKRNPGCDLSWIAAIAVSLMAAGAIAYRAIS
jgi:hypothetical protein